MKSCSIVILPVGAGLRWNLIWLLALLFASTSWQVARSDEPFQPWVKQGRVLAPGFAGPKSAQRLSAPCVVKLSDDRLRMYFWTAGGGANYLFAAECDVSNPMKWELLSEESLLGPDKSSNLRDHGPSFPWVLPRENAPWLLYYCSWGSWAPPGELSNRTCLAESSDEGKTWQVISEPHLPLGPKGTFDAGLTGSVCILPFGSEDYRMWYTAGERYELFGTQKRGIVHIGYATSTDATDWKRHEKPLLSPRLDAVDPFEAVVSKPSVLVMDGVFHMWLSVFCMNKQGYRLAYAQSPDGLNWTRSDKEILTLQPDSFESVNQSYPNVIEVGDELWMFYAGNSFGATGVGLATMPKSALQELKLPTK